jgi:hypothetical protein
MMSAAVDAAAAPLPAAAFIAADAAASRSIIDAI